MHGEMTMNKSELIHAAAESAGMTKKDTERVINAALDLITAQLRQGNKVQLSGFGTFEVKHREARVGRNPVTREAVKIPEGKVPTFKPSQVLKETIGG